MIFHTTPPPARRGYFLATKNGPKANKTKNGGDMWT